MKLKTFPFLLIMLTLALAVRLDLLIANHFVIDSDEAIVGLMGKHIKQGIDFPIFYYGQAYMGSLEGICAAGVFSIIGMSAVALKLVPLVWSLGLVLLVYFLAKEIASERAARIATLLAALPPPAMVIWSSMARGGFVEIIVIGGLALLFTLRVIKRDSMSLSQIALIGFALGVGWWVNNQILYFMLPIAAVLAGRILNDTSLRWGPRIKNLFLVGSIGVLLFLIGGAPYWIYNLNHNWESMGMFQPVAYSHIGKHLIGLFGTALPIIFGGVRFWQEQQAFPGSKTISLLVYALIFISLIFIRRKAILNSLRLKFDREACVELLTWFLVACLTIFVVSSFGWLVQAPRYLLPMYVALPILSAFVLDRLWRWSGFAAGFCVLVIILLNFASMYWDGRAIPGEPVVYNGERVAKDQSELIDWLKQKNIHWIRTNYWIGYRLAFETNEEVKFIVNQAPNQTRIEDWPKQAKDIPVDSMPLVTVSTQARFMRNAMSILGLSFDELVLSGYHVFTNIHAPYTDLRELPKDQLIVSATYNLESANLAIDNNLQTRWGSGQHQTPGMQYSIELKQPTTIRGIRYSLGNWPQDYPRGLMLQLELEDGSKETYFDTMGWQSILFFLELRSQIDFYLKPRRVKKIILTQTGQHPVFDWSIAELSVFE